MRVLVLTYNAITASRGISKVVIAPNFPVVTLLQWFFNYKFSLVSLFICLYGRLLWSALWTQVATLSIAVWKRYMPRQRQKRKRHEGVARLSRSIPGSILDHGMLWWYLQPRKLVSLDQGWDDPGWSLALAAGGGHQTGAAPEGQSLSHQTCWLSTVQAPESNCSISLYSE